VNLLLRPRRAHQAWEEVQDPAVRDQPAVDETERHGGVVGSQHDVAGERQAQAGAVRMPVNRRHHRLGQLRQRHEDLVQQPVLPCAGLLGSSVRVHLGQVAACAERATSPRDEYGAHGRVVTRGPQPVREGVLELAVERVHGVWAVKRQDGQPFVDVDREDWGHDLDRHEVSSITRK
jgi:hypothetical protein